MHSKVLALPLAEWVGTSRLGTFFVQAGLAEE